MKNIFEKTYEQEQKILAEYKKAETRNDEAGTEKAKADYRCILNNMDAKGRGYLRVYSYYRTARERENMYINFDDVFLKEEIEALVSCMRDNGIERFTFSSTWGPAVEAAWLFKVNGCGIEDIIQINGHTSSKENEYIKIPAYLFKIN